MFNCLLLRGSNLVPTTAARVFSKLFQARAGLVCKRTPTKRSYSTTIADNKKFVKELAERLAENKVKNILVYSCKSDGGARVNLLGVIGGFFLLGSAYNSWFVFTSDRFKSRNIDNISGFYGGILRIQASDYFRIALVSIISCIGS
jgi:hypothetical protein